MKIFKLSIALVSVVCFSSCGSKDSAPTNFSSAYAYTPVTGPNVLPIQVGKQSICSAANYINEPCTSVTICVPGTSTCQTISDILVDTGSVGLRVFASAVTLTLPQVKDTLNHPIAECAQFGTGEDWGSVVSATLNLASEPSVTTSIQLIDKTFSSSGIPSACSTADTSPTQAGFNGILGVGLFKQDCGNGCASVASNNIYYGCNAGACSSETVSLANQLQNPVALLPTDNNGVIVEMPLIPVGGAAAVSGSLVLGIGTTTNNMPQGETLFTTSAQGNFTTSYNGQTLHTAFLDSGTNTFSFPAGLSTCASNAKFFCPSSVQNLSATNTGASGTSGGVSFQITSAEQIASGMAASPAIGTQSASMFDWGLPFFFGRRVYVGIETKTSSFGTGPYWAY